MAQVSAPVTESELPCRRPVPRPTLDGRQAIRWGGNGVQRWSLPANGAALIADSLNFLGWQPALTGQSAPFVARAVSSSADRVDYFVF